MFGHRDCFKNYQMKAHKPILILVFVAIGIDLFSNACKKEVDPTVPIDPATDTIPEVDTLQPNAAFSFTVDHLTATFTNESTKGTSYYWWFNDGNTGTYKENPIHEFPRTGTFPVRLIVEGADKRADTITQEVEVYRMDDTENPNFTLDSPYKNYNNWYRGQMHMHTNDTVDGKLIGSPDEEDPPDVMIETYRDKGYDFSAITDHWVYKLDPEVEGILFITGEEVEANLDGKGVHANGFNISDTIPDGTFVEDMIATSGSFVQLNHPTRSGVKYNNINTSGIGLWAIEISNWYNKRPMDLDLWDNQISQGHKIWGNAADDMHDAGGAGHNATMVNSNTLEKMMMVTGFPIQLFLNLYS